MKVTPAMIAAARGSHPVFADVSDDVIRAVLVAALGAAPGARPSPARFDPCSLLANARPPIEPFVLELE